MLQALSSAREILVSQSSTPNCKPQILLNPDLDLDPDLHPKAPTRHEVPSASPRQVRTKQPPRHALLNPYRPTPANSIPPNPDRNPHRTRTRPLSLKRNEKNGKKELPKPCSNYLGPYIIFPLNPWACMMLYFKRRFSLRMLPCQEAKTKHWVCTVEGFRAFWFRGLEVWGLGA